MSSSTSAVTSLGTRAVASNTRRRLAVLGSTGSIGANTLDVAARHPERFEVVALSANGRVDALFDQCQQHRPAVAAMADPAAAAELAARLREAGLKTEVLAGAAALEELAVLPEVDTVMAAVVGAAGLRSALAAANAGKRLLLANKEALVVGGALFMQAVEHGGGGLVPIDSEHSAIFQCLPPERDTWTERLDHIVLTASGGPFRTRDPATLGAVTPEEAVAHPNWVMGRKISVDSATMMNKALEVIEARWLFDLQPDQIRVLIHPQSIIHSMVVFRDNSVLAQLGTPDMRVPIAYGLSWPDRIVSGASRLDLTQGASLSFEPPERARFPGLFLSWQALQAVEGSTTVLNAANEVAVAAFLERRLGYRAIVETIEAALEAVRPELSPGYGVEDLLALDARARAWTEQRVRERGMAS